MFKRKKGNPFPLFLRVLDYPDGKLHVFQRLKEKNKNLLSFFTSENHSKFIITTPFCAIRVLNTEVAQSRIWICDSLFTCFCIFLHLFHIVYMYLFSLGYGDIFTLLTNMYILLYIP